VEADSSERKRNPTVNSPNPDPDVWKSPFEELLDQGTASRGNGFGAEVQMPDPTLGTPEADTAFWEGKQLRARDPVRCGVAERAQARYGLILYDLTKSTN
jgi:hypothetical protein